ncbi:hypothetical protein HDV62DRAFT_366351 [Trichoderma sp. SZMC 28011]
MIQATSQTALVHNAEYTEQAENGVSQPDRYNSSDPHVPFDPVKAYRYRQDLKQELATPVLDELYPNLYLFARNQGHHIDTLSQHRSRGRQIMATEDAHLHLIWRYDCVFIKRIPELLQKCEKWPGGRIPLSMDDQIWGFLRSYVFLIQTQLDFILAQESFLLPSSIDWESWKTFIAPFQPVKDAQVAKRYRYGQLRLSRLNWAVRIFNPRRSTTRWFYALSEWSISRYLEASTVPLLFLFAIISLALSAMQVVLSTDPSNLGLSDSANAVIGNIFLVFSLTVIILSAAISTLLLAIPSTVLIWQLYWGFRHHH